MLRAGPAMDVRLASCFRCREIRAARWRARAWKAFTPMPARCPPPGLDALIVTGAEPRAEDLRDEALLGRAGPSDRLGRDRHDLDLFLLPGGPCRGAASGRHRAPAVGAEIVRRFRRRSALCDDPLLAGMPAQVAVPHSRRNDLSRSDDWRRTAIASCRGWPMAASDLFLPPAAAACFCSSGPSRI